MGSIPKLRAKSMAVVVQDALCTFIYHQCRLAGAELSPSDACCRCILVMHGIPTNSVLIS